MHTIHPQACFRKNVVFTGSARSERNFIASQVLRQWKEENPNLMIYSSSDINFSNVISDGDLHKFLSAIDSVFLERKFDSSNQMGASAFIPGPVESIIFIDDFCHQMEFITSADKSIVDATKMTSVIKTISRIAFEGAKFGFYVWLTERAKQDIDPLLSTRVARCFYSCEVSKINLPAVGDSSGRNQLREMAATLLEAGARMENLSFDSVACRNGIAALSAVLANGNQSPVEKMSLLYSIIKLRDVAARQGDPIPDKELCHILAPF